jgi:hypothetical protein
MYNFISNKYKQTNRKSNKVYTKYFASSLTVFFGDTTLNITTLSIMTFNIIINKTRHSIFTLSIIAELLC